MDVAKQGEQVQMSGRRLCNSEIVYHILYISALCPRQHRVKPCAEKRQNRNRQYPMRLIKTVILALLLVQSAAFSCLSGRLTADPLLPGQQQLMQQAYNPLAGPSYPLVQDSYFTDDYGNILMIVNVLGQVNRQGQVVVRENADFATILALAGGLSKEANLKKVVVARKMPDENGILSYTVNIKDYYKKGDRTNFIALKPNDTIIFPEKAFSIAKVASVLSVIYPWVSIYDLVNRDY